MGVQVGKFPTDECQAPQRERPFSEAPHCGTQPPQGASNLPAEFSGVVRLGTLLTMGHRNPPHCPGRIVTTTSDGP